MRYSITVRYKNRSITVQGSKKFEGVWELNEFIKHAVDVSGYSYGQLHMKTDISPRRMEAIEKDEIDITEEDIKILQRVLKFPKRVVKLITDDEKPLWAKRIATLRSEHYFTQAQVSKALGIALTTYAGYESGKHQPDFETMIKIADIYKVSMDYLIGRY